MYWGLVLNVENRNLENYGKKCATLLSCWTFPRFFLKFLFASAYWKILSQSCELFWLVHEKWHIWWNSCPRNSILHTIPWFLAPVVKDKVVGFEGFSILQCSSQSLTWNLRRVTSCPLLVQGLLERIQVVTTINLLYIVVVVGCHPSN